MKEIFTGNKDFRKSSFLNWRTSSDAEIENILVLADGFLRSSIELAKMCLQDNHDNRADIIIFPILTNANHGIELYLKSMIFICNKLLGSDEKIEEKHHNIQQLLNSVKGKINKYNKPGYLKEFNKLTFGLKKYIDELFLKIKATPQKDNMDFSRYPFDIDFSEYFYINDFQNIEIDLENLVDRFENIATSLEELTNFYYFGELIQEY